MIVDDLATLTSASARWAIEMESAHRQWMWLHTRSNIEQPFLIWWVESPGSPKSDLFQRLDDILATTQWTHAESPAERQRRLKKERTAELARIVRTADLILESRFSNAGQHDGLGHPAETVEVSYRNPLEMVLTASAACLSALVLVAKLIRDWSAKRAENQAAASEAIARARLMSARADVAQTRAALYWWLIGRKISELTWATALDLQRVITDDDLMALERLSQFAVVIELPEERRREQGKG
jgi:hypothetical protein